MARNGSGTYVLPAGQPIAVGTSPISSTTHNTLMSDIATAITGSIAGDGQTVPSANLPMGGYKHTGVASATARTDYCTAGQSQDNTFDWLTSVSGADTITANAAIGMAAYAAGQTFRFAAAGANTTAVTLNINSIGAKAIKKNGTTALAAGDIPSGAVVEVVYDGTNFQFVGCVANKAQSGANSDITSLSALSTPLSIAQGGTGVAALARSIASPGYLTLPGGLILQWGSGTSDVNGEVNITLPLAFPAAQFGGSGIIYGGGAAYGFVALTSLTTTVAQFVVRTGAGALANGIPVNWIVYGH